MQRIYQFLLRWKRTSEIPGLMPNRTRAFIWPYRREGEKVRVIGLTGGVGAGKSRILDILQTEYGAEIIVADQVAHELMEPWHEGYEMVIRALGNSFLKPDGTIDRPLLSALIFHDQNALETMNGIIHPMVWKTIKDKISSSQADLIVVESAIMGREQDDICLLYTSDTTRHFTVRESLLSSTPYALINSKACSFNSLLTVSCTAALLKLETTGYSMEILPVV